MRNIPKKGVRGAVLVGLVAGITTYSTLCRFKENKMMSITNMRRAEERGEQWKIVLKHFKFEDPAWRVKYYADRTRRYDEIPHWLRVEPGRKPMRMLLNSETRQTLGGWWYNKWHQQGHIDTVDEAAHNAYDELLVLAKKRLRMREAHKACLNERDGALPNEKRRIFMESTIRKTDPAGLYDKDWFSPAQSATAN
jgi:hypothetical protein